MDHPVLLLGSGFLAGAMNALAGGGSFVSLPALIAAGVPSVAANASSTIALYPAGLASVWVYRRGLGGVCGVPLRPMLVATLSGGLVGALLLLSTPATTFDVVLPWLLLVATGALLAGPRLGPRLRARIRLGLPGVALMQFGLGIYGGYFGGALGLMMVATWNLLDAADLKALNPPRVLLVSAANSVAVLCFVLAGVVHWPATLVSAIGAVCGAYGGAHVGRRLQASTLRTGTLVLAMAMTVIFFVRAFGRS